LSDIEALWKIEADEKFSRRQFILRIKILYLKQTEDDADNDLVGGKIEFFRDISSSMFLSIADLFGRGRSTRIEAPITQTR